MENSKAMEEGWAFASKVLGGNIAVGNSAQYAKRVTATEQAIEQLNKDLLSLQSNRTIDSTAGYAAEVWHAGTFNVNSAMAGANSKAEVLVGERNMKW